MVDISVRKENELAIMCAVLVIAAIINAVVFGQFAVLTEELKANTNTFMEKLSQINAVLNQQNTPQELKFAVREHILTTHSLKKLQDEF